MNLSIVFPAYNEEENIGPALEKALHYLQKHQGQVIVVNDGSKDHTQNIIDTFVQKYPGKVRSILHPTNKGYGATLRDGFLANTTDWVFYTDSDLQFEIDEIDLLLPFTTNADLVIGYRKNRQDPKLRIFLAWGYNRLIRLVFGLKVRDIDCAFKLFRKEVFQKISIESNRFLVDAEMLIKSKRAGLKIAEVGVTHKLRERGQSTVKWYDILRTLKELGQLWMRL